ncbi:gonadotropin-releasing hormone II receptor-like [Tachysurus fulvidraco]|uniref:gonadotropin-releasing hormone II receptor-like n=1 Tax=Tachysurus fulvidraco TaxID=1234273 RepID=UPI000F4D7390|nr:gonadotropin-releasing hormone II receptor-like [Tachysurus fulvidraco]
MDTESLIKTIIRGIMCLAGIIGNNWLCISSLPKSISQLRTSEALFINLAVSNLITNYMVDTLDIFENEDMPVGNLFCRFRFFLPEFSETSSLLTTTVITVYWHQKLVGSLKHGGAPVRMDNLQVIAMLLTATWTFSFFFNLPHFVLSGVSSGNMTAAECEEVLPSAEAEQAYNIVYTILTNVFPICVVLYASSQIAITLIENENRMKNMGEEVKNEGNASNNKSEDNTNNVSTVTKSKAQAKTGGLVRAAKSVMAVAILFLICWTTHLIVRITDSISPTSVISDIESFIGASYISTIPYIYLYGVQKLTCSTC